MHKQIAESKNLAHQAQELANYIASNDEFFEPKVPRLFRRDKTPGGYRVPIMKTDRVATMRGYRAKSKRQLREAVDNLDQDVIIEDISYCGCYYWRW